jgi:hypothetical protein
VNTSDGRALASLAFAVVRWCSLLFIIVSLSP